MDTLTSCTSYFIDCPIAGTETIVAALLSENNCTRSLYWESSGIREENVVCPIAGEIAAGIACLAEVHGTPAESVFNSVGSVESCFGAKAG